MRFEVPQFIEIEDKIFGPLTWKQFLYVGGGIGMGVVLFLTADFIIFLLVGLPLAVLAGALAFFPINNRPFSYFLESMVNYLRGKKLYIWQGRSDVIYRGEVQTEKMLPPTLATPVDVNLGRPSLARRLELAAILKTE